MAYPKIVVELDEEKFAHLKIALKASVMSVLAEIVTAKSAALFSVGVLRAHYLELEEIVEILEKAESFFEKANKRNK